MRAALVSVEYDDLLAITLPWNQHHFEEVLVVTTPNSADAAVARRHGAKVFETRSFYANGAQFNKWLAFEEGLDWYGRHGLMCLMDADILWPKFIKHTVYAPGYLYSPHRRLWIDVTEPIPPEAWWKDLPLFEDYEWAGYTQIFHAADPHLPTGYWHQVDWNHAGGADSFFQFLWQPSFKLRPRWQVLHLGPPGRNWTGRNTPRVDHAPIANAANRREALTQMLAARPRNAKQGNPYAGERLVNGPAKAPSRSV